MSVDLRAAAADYLHTRRARGYRLADHGWLIASFLDHLAAHAATTISVAQALVFAQARPGTGRRWQAARLRAIRAFAAHVHALDPCAAELIPDGLITAKITRRIPYLYSPEQIAELMSRAEVLSPPLLGASVHTLIGLIAATGLRSGEAAGLDLDHLCVDPPVLTVTGKHGKQRLVPLHPSTLEALTGYQRVRAALTGTPTDRSAARRCSRQPAQREHRPGRLPHRRRRLRPAHPTGLRGATSPRPETHLRGQHPDRRLPSKRRYRRPDHRPGELPRSRRPGQHLLVSQRQPGTHGPGPRPDDHPPAPAAIMTALAPTLQSFFTDYLIGQRAASPHTVTAYRDTFRMLLDYIHQSTGIRPSDLDITKLNAELIAEFLTMLEQHRGNCARTRNARLAAIHSLFQHAALRHPEHAELIARVLAIAPKNTHRTVLTYLTEDEVKALLATPNRATWTGRRDHLIILLMISTGLRVSELTSLTRADTRPESPAHITCHGKGRKDRITPLDAATAAALHVWLSENPGAPTTPVFTARGTDRKLTTDAVAQRIQVHTTSAARTCPTMASRTITPHVLRHTTAMRMLAAGVDITTIALWLGHESPRSTRPYLHADLQLKQRALDRTAPPQTTSGRYTPTDPVLAFLQAL